MYTCPFKKNHVDNGNNKQSCRVGWAKILQITLILNNSFETSSFDTMKLTKPKWSECTVVYKWWDRIW